MPSNCHYRSSDETARHPDAARRESRSQLKHTVLRALLVVGSALLLSSALRAAEAVFAGVPLYSIQKTEDTGTDFGATTPVNAFTPTAVRCPASAGAAGCTLRVSIASQFRDLDADSAAAVKVIINGPGTAVMPSAIIQVASASHRIFYATHSFQWIKRNIPAGTIQTVTVLLGITSGTGSAGARTLSIDVFNGLL